MKLSSKARYAVLALIDLAMYSKKIKGKPVPISLVDIAKRQNLSQQYLEQLFNKLRRAEIVQSVRGQNGGYFLTAFPENILISQIIDAVEEHIKYTKCNPDSGSSCQGKSSKCLSHNLWIGMETTIRSYLTSVTLSDVIEQNPMPVLVQNSLMESKNHAG